MPWTGTTTRSTGFLVTAAVWNSEIVDNMTFLEEVAYTQFTSNVSITATTEGTANQIVTSGAVTYENVPILVEYFAPRNSAAAGTGMHLILRDSTTVIGRLVSIPSGGHCFGVLQHRLSPSAASHTYNVAGYNDAAGTGTINVGAGGATTLLPGFIRIRRIPT